MQVLTWLTIAYTIVLVLTLAIGLLVILVTLMNVGTKLGQIAAGLKLVETQTAPLNPAMEKLNDSLGTLAGGLQAAESGFTSARQHVEVALGEEAVSSR